MNALKFVIVGHVDHGKSTLIGRLFYDTDFLLPDKIMELKEASKNLGRETEFAFLLDHLREEREQGITIDTTQAFFKTKSREYVIIDAPGHREFVRNMITGASQAEAAILIIDVSRGIEEQTRRHAYIIAMLGIEQVVVVLNKMDLVGFNQARFDSVQNAAQSFLDSINIRAKFYIPISALKGDNVACKSKDIKWYSGSTVLESLDALENKIAPQNKPLIFPVQDVYKNDSKRIIVGRVEAGTIRKDQKIKVLPQGETTQVEFIEKFLEKKSACSSGESVGITTKKPLFLERGNIICEPEQEPSLTDSFYANIFWLAKEDFNRSEKLTLRCATQEISCKIEKIIRRLNSSTLEVIEEDADKLSNLEVGEILIKTKRPIVVKRFNELEELGRFVLVKDENICAGGIVSTLSFQQTK
jgi:sulfate adenylyltransferase large subunit